MLWVGSYKKSPVVSITAAFGDTHPTISARGSNRNALGASQPCGLSSKPCFQGRHKHKLTTSSSIRVYSLRFLAPDWTENEEFRVGLMSSPRPRQSAVALIIFLCHIQVPFSALWPALLLPQRLWRQQLCCN